jgi:hypothetical protein
MARRSLERRCAERCLPPGASGDNGSTDRGETGKASARRAGEGRLGAGGCAASRCRFRCPCAGSSFLGFGLRGRCCGGGTTKPRAATMTSRRAAASAGRSRRSTARWRWRGRVGLLTSAATSEPTPLCPAGHLKGGDWPIGSPAMAISEARIRFSASRFRSIAAFQSIPASFRSRRRDCRAGRRESE